MQTRVAQTLVALFAGLLLLGVGGCASQTRGATTQAAAMTHAAAPGPAPGSASSAAHAPAAHPQAVEPVAGAAATAAAPVDGPPSTGTAAAGVSVQASGGGGSLPQPQPLVDVRRELDQSGMSASLQQATLTSGGLAVAPVDAPLAVQEVIAAGNEIARLPYRYGGGHATYEDTAYDCSGSISFVFAAAHLLDRTVDSGELESWGDPGPGRWITVFANAGHTFMYVAGLRFDTVALAETGSRWSARSANEPDLASFTVRHPPGL